MKALCLFALLCATTLIVSCQQSGYSSTNTSKPDSGNFSHNTYRNDFFGFSYVLPSEWHKSRVSPSPLPGGAYYLLIADRYTENPLLSRVMVVADPEGKSGTAHE